MCCAVIDIACATDKTKPLVYELGPKSLLWAFTCVKFEYSLWGPVKKAIVGLANQIEGKFEMQSQ